VLGRIFGTGEREVESYVKGIVCLELIVLGDCVVVRKGTEWAAFLTGDCFSLIG